MKIILIGASGTIGSRIHETLAKKHHVYRAGRTGGDIEVDITSAESIEQMYKSVADIDAVICAAGGAKFGPFRELSEDDFYVGIRSKLMGQVNLVRIGQNYINEGGSFTLTTGILAEEPVVGSTTLAMVNGAVNSFAVAAALELPRGLRINVVSPTVVEDSADNYEEVFPGYEPVSMKSVVAAYVRCLENRLTGRIIRIY
jgi:NAD(P)-dependent dehydrogenase (short-subunit alcohol dehydrogenase family)